MLNTMEYCSKCQILTAHENILKKDSVEGNIMFDEEILKCKRCGNEISKIENARWMK